MTAATLAGRAVLLTGATGFLGGALARCLAAAGCRVIALVRDAVDAPRLAGLRAVAELRSLRSGDWADDWPRALAEEHIVAVIHAATCYGRHGETPAAVAQANVHFPLRLLDAADQAGVGVFINTDTPLPRQLNPYALSKAQFREWGEQAAQRIAFVNVRVENFYGPGEAPSQLVARTVRDCVANVPSLDFTPGEQQRDFIYIDDVVAAYMRILARHVDDRSGVFNYEVGSGKPISIRALVETIRRLSGADTQLRFGALPYRANELFNGKADTSALEALGWVWGTPLETGIQRVIESERQRAAT